MHRRLLAVLMPFVLVAGLRAEVTVPEDGLSAIVEDGFIKAVFRSEGGACASLIVDPLDGDVAAAGGLFRIEESSAPRRPSFRFKAEEERLTATASLEQGLTLVRTMDFTCSPLIRVSYTIENEAAEARTVLLALSDEFSGASAVRYVSREGLRDLRAGEKRGAAVEIPLPDIARPWLLLNFRKTILGLRFEQTAETTALAFLNEALRLTQRYALDVPASSRMSLQATYIFSPRAHFEDFRISGVGRGFIGGFRESEAGFLWRVVPFLTGDVLFSTGTFLPGRRISIGAVAPVKTMLRRGHTAEGLIGRTGKDDSLLSIVTFESEDCGGDILIYKGVACIERPLSSPAARPAGRHGLTAWALPYYRPTLRLFPLWTPGEGAGTVAFEEFVDVSEEPPHDFLAADAEYLAALPPVGLEALVKAVQEDGERLLIFYPRDLSARLLEQPEALPLSPLCIGSGSKEEREKRGLVDTPRLFDAYPLRRPLGVPYKPADDAEVLLTATDGSPLVASCKRGGGLVTAVVLPLMDAPPDFQAGQEDPAAPVIYRDYGRALLARTMLFASGCGPEVGLLLEVSPIEARAFVTGIRPRMDISLESRLPVTFDGVLHFRIRNRWGEIVEKGKSGLRVRPGRCTARTDALNPAGGGRYFVDVWLRHGEYVVSWASASFNAGPAARVTGVKVLDGEILPGGRMPVEIRYEAQRRALVRLSVLDADGSRLYSEERLVEPTADGLMAPALPVGLPEGDSIRVRAAIFVSGIEVDRKESAAVALSRK